MPAPGVRYLVAIDPGQDLGWAFFHDAKLFSCGLARDYWDEIVDGAELVICEEPQIYRRSKARPDDLIKLTRIVGRCEQLALSVGASFNTVKPARWKGQVPKAICHARLLAKLSASERDRLSFDTARVPKGKLHNVLDAIGIGLWRLGR